jgi:hypothetical protein
LLSEAAISSHGIDPGAKVNYNAERYESYSYLMASFSNVSNWVNPETFRKPNKIRDLNVAGLRFQITEHENG